MNNHLTKKKRILMIEDEPDVRKIIKNVFEPYTSYIEIIEAADAGKAMDILYSKDPEKRFDAIILDIMITYGTAAEILDAASDRDFKNCGLRFLRLLRQREEKIDTASVYTPIWVSVITALDGMKTIHETTKLLGKNGRIYTKPFDDSVLENDLALVLGLESNVDSIMLPDNYEPPAAIIKTSDEGH